MMSQAEIKIVLYIQNHICIKETRQFLDFFGYFRKFINSRRLCDKYLQKGTI